MGFISHKLVDRLIVMNKGKLTSKLKNLRQRHKPNLSLSTAMVIENESGNIVPSSSSHETYLVQENSVSSEEELKIVENSIKSTQPTLSANLAMKENQFLTTENKCIPANKAVEPQKRLFSTRKRKRTAEHRAAKPSEKESHKIALSLIMNTK
ncbi:hypothetical protein NPIL_266281 [Nephila pilipes]|uniref:Uncharacterized protein n=1 Tax=Nephila pilipes TaxID=299642 RepID=A0A8X6QKS0_NEPPI|nr:hypothetical protein NPIL_266281 [Nephila pilipes]